MECKYSKVQSPHGATVLVVAGEATSAAGVLVVRRRLACLPTGRGCASDFWEGIIGAGGKEDEEGAAVDNSVLCFLPVYVVRC